MADHAPLRSIESARVAGGLGERVLTAARNFVDDDRSIVAYALVGMYAEGTPFSAVNVEWPDDYPCNRHMFVGMASELIRDHIITDRTAVEVVNRSNGFSD